MKKGHIYFIMGISGAGKGTLIKNLKKLNLDNFHFPLSYKSRPIRHHETNGVDAYFITKEEFEKGIENHEFLEYAIVHQTDYYGTKYVDVLENGIEKWFNVVKELDIHGLKRLLKEKPELRPHFSTVFLDIPVEKLEERIKKRWDKITEEELKRRKESAIMEEQEIAKLADYKLDATLSEKEVVKKFLEIINKNE